MIFLLCLILFNIDSIHSKTISYSANGIWELARNKELCEKNFVCTPSNYSWTPNYSNQFLDKTTGCNELLKKGITKIYLHGDSYVRQIYAAMLITLNGDYRYGSLANATLSPDCEYQKQFFEKRCGVRQLNHYGYVCDRKILLDPYLIGLGDLNHCQKDNGSVVLWSFGNYKVTRYGRHGVNNATMYQGLFESDICPKIRQKQLTDGVRAGEISPNLTCSIWWISTHYRMKAFFDDEKPEMVKNYNEEMRNYFESNEHRCGHINYIDVYNMTSALALDPKTEAEKMTYDGVHWGMEGNLVKAQIILNALISNPN